MGLGAITVLVISVVSFLVGIASLVAVRTKYYDEGSRESGPAFLAFALEQHKATFMRAVAGIVVGLAGLVVFGILMRP